MSIVSTQLIISDKVISNNIDLNQDARSITMRNGYYSDHRYPDNRSEVTGDSYFVAVDSVDSGLEKISDSKTAGQIG